MQALGYINRFRTLPENGVWEKGSAPADRFNELQKLTGDIRRQTLEAMEKSGVAPETTTGRVRQEFADLATALLESIPQFPSHKAQLRELGEASARMNMPYYSLEYRSGGQDATLLISYNQWGSANQDPISQEIRSLLTGFKKIEAMAIKSLQKTGPASAQKKGIVRKSTVKELVDAAFENEQKTLSCLQHLATEVQEFGIEIRKNISKSSP